MTPLARPQRISGILLHPTSLPGRYGIGDLGEPAHQFADFLSHSGMKLWQVLPLGPTGYGDSPYQCFSAFAGNPLLISLEDLVGKGLLSPQELEPPPVFSALDVDYGSVIAFKLPLLRKAWENFNHRADSKAQTDFDRFCRQNRLWLEDYSLFMALKEAHGGAEWNRWDAKVARHDPAAMQGWRDRLADKIRCCSFWQYLFAQQWLKLKEHCHRLGIQLMGDIPIFVAHDSADVWAHPELFYLDDQGEPAAVAGVPPDYFSATGQRWGNPLYRWETMEQTGYEWWVQRFRAIFDLVDRARLDHFRGFESYWEVPGKAPTAQYGRWMKVPGAELFRAVEQELGRLPIIAENLGVITPEVEALREQFGFPGMAVLQFAFGSDPPVPEFLPHNYARNLVVYTGTHDNDTTAGWWSSTGAGDSTRSHEQVHKEREFALKYLGTDGQEIHWSMIRALLASVADVAIIPLQDVLGLGSEARMNLPGRPNGNWRWRFEAEMLTEAIQYRLKELTTVFER